MEDVGVGWVGESFANVNTEPRYGPGNTNYGQGVEAEDETRGLRQDLRARHSWSGDLTSERLGIPGLSTRPYILQGRGCATEAMLVVHSIVHISGHKSRLLWNVPEQTMSWFQNLYRT